MMKRKKYHCNTINKLIKTYRFPEAYQEVIKTNAEFSFDYLYIHLKKINTETVVLFLIYANTIEEDISKYLCILNYLYFIAPYVVGNDIIIYHFVKEALAFSPNDSKILSWVLSVYGGNPDCPFSENELSEFRKLIM